MFQQRSNNAAPSAGAPPSPSPFDDAASCGTEDEIERVDDALQSIGREASLLYERLEAGAARRTSATAAASLSPAASSSPPPPSPATTPQPPALPRPAMLQRRVSEVESLLAHEANERALTRELMLKRETELGMVLRREMMHVRKFRSHIQALEQGLRDSEVERRELTAQLFDVRREHLRTQESIVLDMRTEHVRLLADLQDVEVRRRHLRDDDVRQHVCSQCLEPFLRDGGGESPRGSGGGGGAADRKQGKNAVRLKDRVNLVAYLSLCEKKLKELHRARADLMERRLVDRLSQLGADAGGAGAGALTAASLAAMQTADRLTRQAAAGQVTLGLSSLRASLASLKTDLSSIVHQIDPLLQSAASVSDTLVAVAEKQAQSGAAGAGGAEAVLASGCPGGGGAGAGGTFRSIRSFSPHFSTSEADREAAAALQRRRASEERRASAAAKAAAAAAAAAKAAAAKAAAVAAQGRKPSLGGGGGGGGAAGGTAGRRGTDDASGGVTINFPDAVCGAKRGGSLPSEKVRGGEDAGCAATGSATPGKASSGAGVAGGATGQDSSSRERAGRGTLSAEEAAVAAASGGGLRHAPLAGRVGGAGNASRSVEDDDSSSSGDGQSCEVSSDTSECASTSAGDGVAEDGAVSPALPPPPVAAPTPFSIALKKQRATGAADTSLLPPLPPRPQPHPPDLPGTASARPSTQNARLRSNRGSGWMTLM